MQTELKIFRLLLDHSWYEEHKSKLLPSMFSGDVKTLYDTIVEAHKRYSRDLRVGELRELVRAMNPTLTSAAKSNVDELITDLTEIEPIGPDVAKDVLAALWKTHTFAEIGDIAMQGMNGQVTDLSAILSIIESRHDDFLPKDQFEPLPKDIQSILDMMADTPRWAFNIATLNDRIPGISEGEFVVAFARPETGKTTFHVSLAAAPDGWLWQGAKVAVFCNEEPAKRTLFRAFLAATQMTKEELIADPRKAQATWSQIMDNYTIHDTKKGEISINDINLYCKRFKPDIVVIDQIDKLSVPGVFGATHERYREIYLQAREIAKRHDCAVLGICQASADAEGKQYLHYSMMEGSKTGKAAEADLILGIGKLQGEGDAGDDNNMRYIYASKNKINGEHVKLVCSLDRYKSTYRS